MITFLVVTFYYFCLNSFSIIFSYKISPFFILFSFRILPYFHFFFLPNVSLIYPLLSWHTHSYQSNDHLHNNLQRIIKKFLKTPPSLLLSFFYQIFPVTWYFCFFLFLFMIRWKFMKLILLRWKSVLRNWDRFWWRFRGES